MSTNLGFMWHKNQVQHKIQIISNGTKDLLKPSHSCWKSLELWILWNIHPPKPSKSLHRYPTNDASDNVSPSFHPNMAIFGYLCLTSGGGINSSISTPHPPRRTKKKNMGCRGDRLAGTAVALRLGKEGDRLEMRCVSFLNGKKQRQTSRWVFSGKKI